MQLITLFLTCADREEADKITAKLLDGRLAACIKRTDVKSDYLWKGQKQRANETLLIVDTAEDKFDEIEKAVRQIHSYETFVLTAYPVIRASANVEQWLKESVG